MMNKILSVALIFLATSFSGMAQSNTEKKLWSLEDCVSHAMDNSLEVQKQLLGVYYRNIQTHQAKWNKAGTVSGSVYQGLNIGRSLNSNNNYINSNSWSTGISADYSVLLYNGFRLQNLEKMQKLLLEANRQELESLKEDIALQVVMAYLDVVYSKERVKVSKVQYQISKENADRIQTRFDIGEATKDQILENASLLATEESNVIDAEAQVTYNTLVLKQLLNLDYLSEFDVIMPVTEELNADLILANATDFFETAVANRPSVKALEYYIKSDKKQLEATKATLQPSLGFGYSFGTDYNNKNAFYNPETQVFDQKNFAQQLDINRRQSLGIRLSIPIFDGFRARNNVKSAEIQIKSRETDLEIEKRNMIKTLQRVFNDAFTAKQKYVAAQKVMSATQASFNFAKEKQKMGVLSIYDYTISKNNLSKAELQLVQAKYQFIFASKVLDYYRGKEISL